MECLVVGDEDCTISNIVITTTAVSEPLLDHWRNIANHLKLTIREQHEIEVALLPGKGIDWALEKMLTFYRSRKSRNARLMTLIEALETEGLNDIAKALRKRFGKNTSEVKVESPMSTGEDTTDQKPLPNAPADDWWCFGPQTSQKLSYELFQGDEKKLITKASIPTDDSETKYWNLMKWRNKVEPRKLKPELCEYDEDLDDLVVGDEKNCNFNDVVITIMETNVPFSNYLINISSYMGLSAFEEQEIYYNLHKHNANPSRILQNMLVMWSHEKVKDAKLATLIKIFEQVGLKEIAVALTGRFICKNQTPQPTKTSLPTNDSETGDWNLKKWIKKDEPRKLKPELYEYHEDRLITNIYRFTRTFPGTQDKDVYYPISAEGIRMALIINNIQYMKQDDRIGGIYDSHNLDNLLTKLSYNVTLKDDRNGYFTKKAVENIIVDFKAECVIKEVESVVLFIGGHGQNGKIILSSEEELNLFDDIVYKIADKPNHESEYAKRWTTIPKVFIVCTCRDPVKTDSQTRRENIVVCYSTLPDCSSYRNDDGTRYVKYFTQVMMQKSKESDFISILEKINKELQEQHENTDEPQQPTYDIIGNFGRLTFVVAPDT